MLIHMSFPCTTYSSAAGNTHRHGPSIAAQSAVAAEPDAMLDRPVGEAVGPHGIF